MEAGSSAKEMRLGVELPEAEWKPNGEIRASETLSMLREGEGV